MEFLREGIRRKQRFFSVERGRGAMGQSNIVDCTWVQYVSNNSVSVIWAAKPMQVLSMCIRFLGIRREGKNSTAECLGKN